MKIASKLRKAKNINLQTRKTEDRESVMLVKQRNPITETNINRTTLDTIRFLMKRQFSITKSDNDCSHLLRDNKRETGAPMSVGNSCHFN